MEENKYSVYMGVCKLSSGMCLEDALLFLKALCEKYYLEKNVSFGIKAE